MKIRLSAIAAVVATVALTMSGCADSSGDSVDNQQIIENNMAGDNPDFDAQVDKMKQDIYEERLFEACWDANVADGWSEDDLITYCNDNLYDYEDLGSGSGLPAAPAIDEMNDCTQGDVEVYIFNYVTPDATGEVDAAALCQQDAERYAADIAPPGASLVLVATS